MFCGTDNIMRNILHIQVEYGNILSTMSIYKIFLAFNLNVRNIPHNTVNPTKHYYGFEQCYAKPTLCIIIIC